MIRVFLVDDHVIVREGIRRLIEDCTGMTVVGEVSSGREVLRRAESESWDVLVLDLSLPDMNGTEVLNRVLEIRPALKVVVLSMYPEDQYGLRLLSMGAWAYLSKDRPPEELLDAIRRVASGRRYITDSLAELAASPQRGQGAPHEHLTDREYQVFLLLFHGKSPAMVGEELKLMPSTVSTHIKAIKAKLGVQTLAEIVQYAFRAGISE
ncbi:MAG: response regulator transcription factor [Deltaproteobacteria bacterium]|nr:response regulator transcription factor [Deltaproteobacteria bacterium]